MSLKFSLRSLLVLIAVICIACAALANAGIWWHSIIVTSTLTGLTGLLIWGTLHAGSRRAFACGWLLFAAGYLALVFGPWTGNHLGANLITTKGLALLERRALGNTPSPAVIDFNGNTFNDLDVDVDSGNNIWTSYQSANVLGSSWVITHTTFQSTGHWLLASAFGYCGAHLAAFLCLHHREPSKA